MEIIKERKSVRTFDEKKLSDDDIKKLTEIFEKAENPYGVKIEYRFLEPEKYNLKSPVLGGVTLYLAAKLKRVPHFEVAFGFSFETVVLEALKLGIGTVWIAGTMNRENFEKAMELKEDELMPCMTPVGYPAKKRSIKEAMMRKGIKADSRFAIADIAFEDEPGKPLSEEALSKFNDALEMVRWAPSAVNKQPWRMIVCGDSVHFYEKQDNGYVKPETGDLQRIDVGIAMCHFDRTMKAAGKNVELCTEDPGIKIPADWHYVASYKC